MLKNFLITAWRRTWKNRSFAVINLLGLSVGLAAFMMIALYVKDELNYDRWLKGNNRLYQVNLSGNFGGQELYVSNTPPPTGASLVEDFPGIEKYTRVYQPGDVMVSRDGNGISDKYFTEKKLFGVDSSFFQLFQLEPAHGNPAQAFIQTKSIVITESIARKYFDRTDVVGQVLLCGNEKIPYTVSLVLKDIPAQSSLQFDFLVPISNYPVVARFNWSWVWLNVNTYVLLSPSLAGDKQAIAKMETQFTEMVKKRAAKAFERIGMPMETFFKNGGHWDLKLQAYNDVHLHSDGIVHTLLKTGNIRVLYIFGIVAIFIILLACVNFMNLSTAKSFNRARETGIRKVMGSTSGKLVTQFLLESLILSLLAAVIAVVLVSIFLPAFNRLASKQLIVSQLLSGGLWLPILITILLTGLVAGSYPAFYLSSFRPVQVLKGRLSTRMGNLFVRNGLVVFQFTISVALIISTGIVFNQLKYMQGKELGMDKENVLIISNSQRLGDQEETFRQQILSWNSVAQASITTNIPSGGAFGDRYIPEAGARDEMLAPDVSLFSYLTDENFIDAMNIKVEKGRNFSKVFNDSASVILNETAARQIGWKDPVGRYIRYPGGDDTRFKVVGVVKDFTVQSFRELVVPFALFHYSSKTYDESQSYLVIKLKAGQTQRAISDLEKKWKSFVPGKPFDYSFLDEQINAQYKGEVQMSRVFVVFAILSVLVACLGLFGLSAYTAERRTKEISIRKVLGASVATIVALLSRDFLKLVVIALVVASPIAWYFMNQWLQDYAYRTNIGWAVFLVGAMTAIVVAICTVGFHAIRAALANPAKSLRSE